MTYDLPKSLCVCGKDYAIRSDFRDAIDILQIMGSDDLDDSERGFLTLLFFYPEFEDMPQAHYQEAIRQCVWFLNGGRYEADGGDKTPGLVDWDKDLPYIISPINRVIGHEIRADKYLHWWTFLYAYMEIGDCTFAQIVRIRSQKAWGKPLDQSDREWYRRNRDLVDTRQHFTQEENDLVRLWGGK